LYTKNAKERILKSAVKIFAEKSYEGARIDEIAKEAQVPKSLIYYHFSSKEEILHVLVDAFVKEYMEMIEISSKLGDAEKGLTLSQKMSQVYYEFGQRNADLVRVILIDSLKKTKDKPVLFQVVEAMIAKEIELKGTVANAQERRIVQFFTNLIPNYAYVCYADAWVSYFQMEREEFDKLYIKVYEETYGAHHYCNE
jgi:AcrR family transcriptional regulator